MFAPLPSSPDEQNVVRLAVVEAQRLVREALVAVIRRTPGLECVVAAAEIHEAVREAEFTRPDVALLDTSTGRPTGGPGLRLWRERLPFTRLLLFDDQIRDVHVRLVLKRQADGYATKRDAATDLIAIIRECARGETVFSPLLAPRLQRRLNGWELLSAPGKPGLHALTIRETEVLVFLAQGLDSRRCSEFLGISPSTVDNHKARILRKLQIRKTIELTRLAMREGLLPR